MPVLPSVNKQSFLSCRNVLIVGGGPTGLATALMLAKRNWTEITVLEKRAAADYYEPDKSFNYLIDGRGQKLTDLLGLTEPLAAIGVSNKEFYLTRIQPGGDRKTFKVPLIDPTRKTAYWVPRRAFVQLLYQEIQQNWSDKITVLFNTQCVAIKTIHDETELLKVLVEVEDSSCLPDRNLPLIPQPLLPPGGEGEPEINKGVQSPSPALGEGFGVRASETCQPSQNSPRQLQFEPNFLIGCDGLHSIVRSTLNTWDASGKFEMRLFPSPSSGLRYKVLSLPPNFPLDAEGKEPTEATMSYVLRGTVRERNRSLSMGLLPLKDPDAPRTANLITYPDHPLWELKTPETVLEFLDQTFPQLPLRNIVSPEEIERFANSKGGAFPVPQFCAGLQYLLSSNHPDTRDAIAPAILLLGDAIHCFPPDIGQGVNSALEDVFVLHHVLEENEDELGRSLPQYEAVRSPDGEAVVRLAQITAPWQYNQNPLRSKLWIIAFIVRLGLSKVLPFIDPPAFALIQNHNLSYGEIWRRNQRTKRSLWGLLLLVLIGLTGTIVLLQNR